MANKPEKFGKYILLEKIAQGGMAEIFLSRTPGAGGISKFTAIKRILPQYSDNQDFIRMFKDEAKIVVNLSHSNIVSVNEFGVVKNLFFLVMDYVPGRNMRQILNKMSKKDTHFSIEQIVYIVNEVAAGLDHAHRCLDEVTGKPLNITHRDMSPQNVMISFEGEVKIVDFGIAKAESQIETTRAGTLKGKFGYMSPEQAEGQAVDLRTDIFSLGIVLWEMLANERLFIANNEINTLRKIRDCQVPSLKKFNPNIHPELERIVMKGLARDRNMRYQTAAAMHRDLNRFLNRHYPDFSPQDFAVTIKTLFADEILQSRKRMQEYAKLPVNYDYEEENSMRQHMISNATPDSQDGYSDASLRIDNKTGDLHPHIKIDLNQKSSGPLNLGKLKASLDDQMKEKFNQRQEDSKNPTSESPVEGEQPTQIRQNVNIDVDIPRQTATERRQEEQQQLATNSNRSSQATRTNSKAPPEEPAAFKPMFLATFIMLAIAAGLLLMPSKQSDQGLVIADPAGNTTTGETEIGSTLPPTGPVVPSTSKAGTPTSADKNQIDCTNPNTKGYKIFCSSANVETAPLMVQSKPSGASIYIDGINTGHTTPSSVLVPRHKPFDMVLKKKDYIEYEDVGVRYNDHRESKRLLGTLQEARIGYIAIDVIPPQNVKVYVNGKFLEGMRLPIKKYAVPAGNTVKVEAINPIRGVRDFKYVEIKHKQLKTVNLKLNRKKSRSRK